MIFPIIQPKLYPQNAALPLFREIKWDYTQNIPIWRDSSPVIIDGAEAVLVWAYNAMQAIRYRHDIYSWDYGCELDSLIGSGYTEELQQSEAARYVRECLQISPYIKEVNDIKTSFTDGKLSVSCKMITVYGEVDLVA